MAYRRNLASAFAKIDRAEAHRNSLEKLIERAHADPADRVEIVAEFNPKIDEYIVCVSKMPTHLVSLCGLEIGDCVHNLRCALDHVAWQLALEFRDGRRPLRPRNVQFPIFDFARTTRKRPGFDKAKVFTEIDPAHRTRLGIMQPYTRTHLGRSLAALRDLDNTDKHQVLNPVLIRTEEWDPFTIPIDGITFRHAAKMLKVGAEVMRLVPFDPPPDPQVKVYSHLTPYIHLRHRGDPVWVLKRLIGMTEIVVKLFD